MWCKIIISWQQKRWCAADSRYFTGGIKQIASKYYSEWRWNMWVTGDRFIARPSAHTTLKTSILILPSICNAIHNAIKFRKQKVHGWSFPYHGRTNLILDDKLAKLASCSAPWDRVRVWKPATMHQFRLKTTTSRCVNSHLRYFLQNQINEHG